jgi:tellurite methyltransferase
MVLSSFSNEGDERERWNHKYREAPTTRRSSPDPFLVHAFSEYIQPLYPDGGRALDLAGGAGRHAIWLAKQGWEVTLMDVSEAGVERARQSAGALASNIDFVVGDVNEFKASQTYAKHSCHTFSSRRFECHHGFEVVMVFFYLDRKIFPELLQAMRPGGLLIYKTYMSLEAKLNGPKNPAHLLEPGELLRLVAGLRVLHYREEVAEKATAELVARKVATGTRSHLDL